MSTANTFHPHLRLLERPAVRVAPRPPQGAEPASRWTDWWVQQVERYWAWGDRLHHHRMGSYTAH
jgi:hypothetical protein